MKPAISLILLFLHLTAPAQNDLSRYLGAHHYSFSMENGFDGQLADTLQVRLAPYRLILQAEGGSHYLTFYQKLAFDWLTFLHERRGLTHFVWEAGTSNAVLINRFLATGDTSMHLLRRPALFEALFRYNSRFPPDQRLLMTGVDFERPVTYARGLKLLLPEQPPPEAILAAIELIRQAPDSGYDCDGTLRMNAQLNSALNANEISFRKYFGDAYGDFEKIVRNNGTCKDGLRNRNGHMAENFLAFDRDKSAPVYYAEFGEAHTILKNRDFASIINDKEPMKNKVAVINLYCYDCSTPGEGTSNWALNGIEKDILRYFLPLCEGDFTLFDLSGDDPVAAPYRAYGQFLIIAKGQH